jgi:hypothetical protein
VVLGSDAAIKSWYNDELTKDEKKMIVDRAREIMEKKGLVLIGWRHDLMPQYEFPHEAPEKDRDRRRREHKEEKIMTKAFATAAGEFFVKHLKGEF